MFDYMQYGPYICIAVVLLILFALWAFLGGKKYEFVGLAPLDPTTCSGYTGSIYSWGSEAPGEAPGESGNQSPDSSIENAAETNDIQTIADIQVENRLPTNGENSFIDPSESLPDQNSPMSLDQVCVNLDEQICVGDDDEVVIDNTPPVVPVYRDVVAESVCLPTVPKIPEIGRKKKRVSKGELLCCQTMQRIYGLPFTSVWPDWLRNPETGRALELDCYNEELQMAVEYNGIQHYAWPNFTGQSRDEFVNQVRRDNYKETMCEREGVYLIVVPYNVLPEKIPEYIISKLPETIRGRLETEGIDNMVE